MVRNKEKEFPVSKFGNLMIGSVVETCNFFSFTDTLCMNKKKTYLSQVGRTLKESDWIEGFILDVGEVISFSNLYKGK